MLNIIVNILFLYIMIHWALEIRREKKSRKNKREFYEDIHCVHQLLSENLESLDERLHRIEESYKQPHIIEITYRRPMPMTRGTELEVATEVVKVRTMSVLDYNAGIAFLSPDGLTCVSKNDIIEMTEVY